MTEAQIQKVILKALKSKGLLDKQGEPLYQDIFIATGINYRTIKGIVNDSVDYKKSSYLKLIDYLGLKRSLTTK